MSPASAWPRTALVLAVVLAGTALLAAAVLAAPPASQRTAASVTNACRNNVTANNSQITVSMSGVAAPNPPANPGDVITLSTLQQTANVPGSIFVAGYNLGLLSEGENSIPAKVFTKIEGTNTVEGIKNTSLEDVTITTTITDPDHSPGTGDETATDGQFSVTYDDMTFTADADGGLAEFRQDTQYPLAPSPEGSELGSLVIRALVGGVFKVRFACSPGTVTPPDPGTVTQIDPAPFFGPADAPTPSPSPTESATAAATETTTATGTTTATQTTTATETTTASPTATASPTTTATPKCLVPNVKGKKLRKAKTRIRKAGCKVGSVTRKKRGKAKHGRVVKQRPKGGRSVAEGTKVKLTVGR